MFLGIDVADEQRIQVRERVLVAQQEAEVSRSPASKSSR